MQKWRLSHSHHRQLRLSLNDNTIIIALDTRRQHDDYRHQTSLTLRVITQMSCYCE